MTDTCPAIEILATLAELPLGDPDRVHLDGCPRCQARLADYRDFMDGGVEVPGELLADALEQIDRRLGEEIHPDVLPFRPRSRARILSRPLVRAAMAVAALLLFAVALNGLRDRPEGEKRGEIRLRDTNEASNADLLSTEDARLLADGAIEFSWSAHPGADAYLLRILGADLVLVEQIPTGDATSLRLEADRLAGLLDGDRLFAWQVTALFGDDPIAHSRPAPQRLDSVR